MTHRSNSHTVEQTLTRHLRSSAFTFGFILSLFIFAFESSSAPSHRTNLVEAILSDDFARQGEIIKGLIEANDPLVEQGLTAWRGGAVYLLETNETKIPFLLEAALDADGNAKGIRLIDGEFLKGADGKPLAFAANDLTAADATSKLRKAIKATLDLFALGNPNPKMRRDAVIKLGQEQNPEYLPFFETRLKSEKEREVIKALHEAVATTQLASEDEAVRTAAVVRLGEFRSHQPV